MCDHFRGIRDGRLTVSHAHGSAKNPLQDVCMLQMGSVCERVRLISTRLLAPYVLSFPLHRLDSGSLPSTLKSMSRPLPCPFPAERAIVR